MSSRHNSPFSSVQTEGGLLPQDLLSRIQSGDKTLDGVKPESYHLAPHERVGEAVNRAWSRLTALWHGFQEALASQPDSALATGLTRDRWLLPLFQELGYGRLPKGQAIEADDKRFAVSHSWQHSPIHLLGVGVDLDRRQAGVAGAAKASPHGLVQEFLNRSDDHLWGFVSNGLRLRILRDHHSLTRQAYVEFDLQAIMDGEQYSEFLLLWMVCHQSRVEADKPADCWLEQWFNTSQQEGVRALDKLRAGVEQAIAAFGTGFVAHRGNTRLLDALASGELDKQEYYRQLLRLVYRLIFLFVAEGRDALLDPQADAAVRDRYLRFYATGRLRELADKRRGGPHGDLWQGLRLVMFKLYDGCPELALPALGNALWGPTGCPWLMEAECGNEHLLDAVRSLSNIQEGKTRYPVNWRNVGADELGSIYEGLLELHPRINKEAGTFELDTAAGHERKTTGSYYTPTELVDCLLDSALDPVVDEACRKPDPEAAILDLNVCDPACGSGHFLVAAARRIAKRLAAVRAGEDEPSPSEVQRALRDVVGRCIYGVDVNPMAVELCKVSLWMEAIEPGRPLSFLDSHIQCGNALLGATPALMARGIPNEAFKPIEGDNKEVAKRLRKRNAAERKSRQISLALPPPLDAPVVEHFRNCDRSVDFDLAAVREHESCWLDLQESNAYRDAKFQADAWCAAFVWPKEPGKLEHVATTQEVWRQLEDDVSTASPVMRRIVRELARQHQFFHWYLAFPQVFGDVRSTFDDCTGWRSGFDVVLGNPPWDRMKLQEVEWFSSRAPEIACAATASERRNMIGRLADIQPCLFRQYKDALRASEAEGQLVRVCGRFPLCGVGDLNSYALFAEWDWRLINGNGMTGFVVPTALVTGSTTQEFFHELIGAGVLASFLCFKEIRRVFLDTDSPDGFGLMTVRGAPRADKQAVFAFGLDATSDLNDESRQFALSASDVALINPNTKTCPIFESERDATIAKRIYSTAPILVRETSSSAPHLNPWDATFIPTFHMTSDSHLFRRHTEREEVKSPLRDDSIDSEILLPLVEAKLFHHFNHRYGDYADNPEASKAASLPAIPESQLRDPNYEVTPRYWVEESDVLQRVGSRWKRGWVLAIRNIAKPQNQRTLISTILPISGLGNSASALAVDDHLANAFAVASSLLSSFVSDYITRLSMSGTNVNQYILKQLPFPAPEWFSQASPWERSITILDWLRPRVVELCYTAWDLHQFADDCGWTGRPPFLFCTDRRVEIRVELDAAFFHLYELDRKEVDHIMDSFSALRRADLRIYGDFRTKLQILDIYDRMQRAIDTGEPYQTLLDPPPADPHVAHPESTRPDWAQSDG